MLCALVALLSFASGCAGYKLGPTNGLPAGAQSVQVSFFENKTLEPRLPTALNQALRRTLQQDGTFRLVSSPDADVVISGAITRYERQGLTFQPGDVLTVRDFDVILIARVTAVDRSSGKTLFDRDFSGKSTVRVGADLFSAERQALPLLAQDLARNITTALAEGSW